MRRIILLFFLVFLSTKMLSQRNLIGLGASFNSISLNNYGEGGNFAYTKRSSSIISADFSYCFFTHPRKFGSLFIQQRVNLSFDSSGIGNNLNLYNNIKRNRTTFGLQLGGLIGCDYLSKTQFHYSSFVSISTAADLGDVQLFLGGGFRQKIGKNLMFDIATFPIGVNLEYYQLTQLNVNAKILVALN